ncbi:DNA polymerase subunit Cdc27 [Aspergillus spinulosporus]
MAIADHKKYLAEAIIHEHRTVTYRSLGRALRVHSTLAKQMLYEFHLNENSKKPSSVHATYVLTGVPKPAEPVRNGAVANGNGDNEDDIMPSSPYISSSLPNPENESDQVPMSAVLLAREEDLEGNLQPTILQDLNVLTDVSREMLVNHAQEDPLEYGRQWGMIQNNNVKRRAGARPPPPSSTVPAKRPVQSEPVQPRKAETKNEELSKPLQRQNSASSARTNEKAPPANKEKGSLFSSFAKTKPKLKKEDSATPAASAAESAATSGAEDVVLDDASEDEQEDLFPESRKEGLSETRESRKEREERLRKMMEDDGWLASNIVHQRKLMNADEDEEMLDATEPPTESETIDKPPPEQEDLKVEATVKGGRRRGRRQVMKKVVKKDSEGYLVTVEEPSWESFSEDEPAPPPPKKKPGVSAPKGKPGAKAGQGNIMSFFGKK